MADLEKMSDSSWHTLLLNLFVEYVTLLTNPEGPAPSAPTLTRQEILELNAARKEACAASTAAAAAANAGSGGGGGDSDGGGGDGDGDGGDGDGDEADDTSGPAAKAGRGRGEGGGGRRGREPFESSLTPWRNCHCGAWNKTLLITHTRVRIE
jgi:hypothetical protein